MLARAIGVSLLLVKKAAHAAVKIEPITTSTVAFDISVPLPQLFPNAGSGQTGNGTHGLAFHGDEVPRGVRRQPLKSQSQSSSSKQDGALDSGLPSASSVLDDPFSFEGLSSRDNELLLKVRGVPPDPVGDVGKHHYIQMINLAWAIFNKDDGTRAYGPFTLGSLWNGFRIKDCSSNNGDPIVLYDQFAERWLFTQFTTECDFNPGPTPCYNCLAVSVTDDPMGPYYRYAFSAQQDPDKPPGGTAFPDYPKWGVWGDSYILTTRDFYNNDEFGVSVYAIDKAAVLIGNANTRVQRFSLAQNVTGVNDVREHLFGNGLLPPDTDGHALPPEGSPAPIIGTVDDDLQLNLPWTPLDGLNIWELSVDWDQNTGSLSYSTFLSVAEYLSDSIFLSGLQSGVPQPGVDVSDYLDSVSSLTMHRLAYRNWGDYESLVTCQAVVVDQGFPRKYGKRWYEIRRHGPAFWVHQQGTYSPPDDTSRWMGSIAQDASGNMAMGFSVSDAFSTFPGLRLTGRLVDDPMNLMTLGEATIVDGEASQRDSFNRWGDYSSMNLDPEDDCTFYFTGEYYTSQESRDWQTRIAKFELPGCKGGYKKSGKGKVRG